MPEPTTLQRQVLAAIGLDREFGPADISRVLDELAVVIAALCVADPRMLDLFLVRLDRALAKGEECLADDRPPPHQESAPLAG